MAVFTLENAAGQGELDAVLCMSVFSTKERLQKVWEWLCYTSSLKEIQGNRLVFSQSMEVILCVLYLCINMVCWCLLDRL